MATSLRLASKKKVITSGINRFLAQAQPPLKIGQAAWALSFSAGDNTQLSSSPLLTVRAQMGAHQLYLALSTEAILILLGSCVDPSKSTTQFALTIPPWMALACLEAAVHETLEAIEQHIGQSVRLTLATPESQQPVVLSGHAQHPDSQQAVVFSLMTDEASFSFLLKYWPTQKFLPNPALTNVLAHIPVVCHLSLCRIRLARRRFMQLRAGDVVALMISVLEDGAIPVIGLLKGAFYFKGRAYPNKLVIDMVERNGGQSDEDDDLSFDDDDFDNDWDEFEEDDYEAPEEENDSPKEENDSDKPSADATEETSDEPSPADADAPRSDGAQERWRSPSEKSPPPPPPPSRLSNASYDDTDTTLDDVPLRIDLRVSQLHVPLGNLKSFAPGMTIELEQALPATVDFIIEDKTVAQGELVDVEGTLGVVVTRIGEKESV